MSCWSSRGGRIVGVVKPGSAATRITAEHSRRSRDTYVHCPHVFPRPQPIRACRAARRLAMVLPALARALARLPRPGGMLPVRRAAGGTRASTTSFGRGPRRLGGTLPVRRPARRTRSAVAYTTSDFGRGPVGELVHALLPRADGADTLASAKRDALRGVPASCSRRAAALSPPQCARVRDLERASASLDDRVVHCCVPSGGGGFFPGAGIRHAKFHVGVGEVVSLCDRLPSGVRCVLARHSQCV